MRKPMGETEDSLTDFYERDHDRLDGLFSLFRRLKGSDFAKAREFFKEFMLGLHRHIAWEENILFPIFEKKSGLVGVGPTLVMRREHELIKESLEDLYTKVQKGDVQGDADEKRLLEVLSQHNMKEERILYPAIDGMLESCERVEVLDQMRRMA